MKYSAVLLLTIIFSLTLAAQQKKPKSSDKTSKTSVKTSKPPAKNSKPPTGTQKAQAKTKFTNSKTIAKKTSSEKKPNVEKKSKPEKEIGSEKEEFEKAVALTDAARRIASLRKFIGAFPNSEQKIRAQELIVSARAELGDIKLKEGATEEGLKLFMQAVRDAPKPMSEGLFTNVILQFPTNLFFRGERNAAFDIADIIEEKAEGNAKQLLGLATFYLGIESAAGARKLANKAIEIETASPSEKSNLPAAYQTLGFAYRLGFQLEDSANAYAKALEMDAESVVSKRSLAEMKRATGKPDVAAAIYRELLAGDENDITAKTGLTLSLFDAGKREEAEAEMRKTLEAEPNNLFLLVGAAYWYASKNEGAKAVELAQEALKIEPRYTWAYIAMGRGYMAQKQPLEAERVLLSARNFGVFPTLDYEIAAARLQAGFYREAADELKKKFAVKNGTLETRLGGRIAVEAEDFIKLLTLERQASIFQPNAANADDEAQKLKSLLVFSQEINAPEENIEAISAAADDFVRGDDRMKIHRQLFVANRLLDKKKALPKVLEMTQAAVRQGVDSALDVSNPSAAIMADELYETRSLAIAQNQVLLVPDVPRQTLLSILRGRIEEISGWTLYQQDDAAGATTRLKRAVSVLPEKSSWWRSSVWRLGNALEADGKQTEALENYIKVYKSVEQPDPVKYAVIESLYQKVNGNVEGLESKIGAKSAGIPDTIAKATEPETDANKPSAETESDKNISEPENSETSAANRDMTPVSEQTNGETSEKPKAETSPEKTESSETAANENDSAEQNATSAEKPEETSATEVKTDEAKPENAETKLPETEKVSESVNSSVPETSSNTETDTKQKTAEEETTNTEPEEKEKTSSTQTEQTENNTETVPPSVPTDAPENNSKPQETPTENQEITNQNTEPETNPETPNEQVSTDDAGQKKPESENTNSAEQKPPTDPVKPEEKTSPKKEKMSVVITENAPLQPAEKQNKTGERFEPVIINLPKPETAEKPKPKINIFENPPVFRKEKSEPVQSEKSSETTAENQEKTDSSETAPASRPRVVIEDKLNPAATEAKTPQCKISVSQENISLINSGGSIGILVEYAGDSAENITTASSSPSDVRVAPDTEFGNIPGRVFFIIKSVSDKVGVYTVTFESGCGKKEIQVKVR